MMSENTEPKKISLQDAIRQKLAQKKQQANSGNQSSAYFEGGPKAMKSQNNKKPNNQRRRTGDPREISDLLIQEKEPQAPFNRAYGSFLLHWGSGPQYFIFKLQPDTFFCEVL